MSAVVSRTCTELRDAEAAGSDVVRLLVDESRPLSEYRSMAAYVLLGDPGAGKTTEFDRESWELGDAALMVSARDFVALDLDSRPEWRDKVLFIDGLDEVRAGREDSRVPLDEIRNRLDRLRPPGFRISCREADWLGHSDRRSLEAVSRDATITVLKLDPLSPEAAGELLESLDPIPDVQAFIAKADQMGLGAMLGNPLTLDLLAGAVRRGGGWPKSRLEIFEMACQKMAIEHNREHLAASAVQPTSTVLSAAGHLCALVLLAGIEGYAHEGQADGHSIVALSSLGKNPGPFSLGDLQHALGTKLFISPIEGVFTPRHRQVAEFLAGQHLAKLIGGGLPARRVISLMTSPSDERVVTSLRGLSAWLSAYSREARPLLIDADPVGVGLYGDIGDLTTREKVRVLESLSAFAEEASLLGHQRQDGRSRGYRDDTAWAFRCLATADMVPTMRQLLSRPSSNAADDRLATLILETLSLADTPRSVVDLKEDLEAILWSETRSSPLKRRALDAYLHIVPSGDDRTAVLRLLLDAVQDGSVPDPDDEVRGGLLEILYPEAVTPSEVWRYALSRSRHDLIGRFWRFWNQTLLEEPWDQHLAELLDSLYEDASRLVPGLEQSNLDALPAELLARCLEADGDNREPAQLYGWLAAAGSALGQSHRKEEPARRVRAWLEARPEVQREVVLTWLRQRDPDDLPHPVGYWFCEALHDSTPPPDFALWCLDQAIEVSETEPEVSQALLRQAHGSLLEPSMSVGLTLEDMRERLGGHPALVQHLDEYCERRTANSSVVEDEFQRKMKERREQWDEEQRQRREDWTKHLREQEAELRGNRFSPQNLATLADVCLGLVVDVDRHASPHDRISDFIGGDPRLVDAVMIALRDAASRDEVPEVDRTVSLSLESRHSWLARPVLASLKLLDKEDPERPDPLTEAQKRKALAIYYCVPHGTETPRWHHRWLEMNPEMVLDVLFRCAVAAVRAGEDLPPGLNDLDVAKGIDSQAHDIRLRLLEAFPTRSSNKQLGLLDRLLTRALDHPDREPLQSMAQRKQGLKSVPVAQRVRWWATDALIDQGTRLRQLRADLAESEVRIRHLAEFLRSVWDRHDSRGSILAEIRDPSALGVLIEILGRWCAAPQYASGFVTLEMEMSDLISRLIAQLGSEPGDEAKQTLARLVEDPELEGWRPHLERALEEQRVIQRDASYDHPDIEQVQDTLNDGTPANAADLRALLVDRLDDIRDHLRGGNTDLWRQFWNEERPNHLTASKPEDSCRDALLANLQLRLPDGVDSVPEGHYAADARADIRASRRRFNVPVEVKKDSHRDLWRAMRDQLMAKYTTDPATEGYGIYLVLWFADPDKPISRSPDGVRPSSPDELRQWLEQDLNPEEARKISVIVVDVTKPGRGPGG